MSNELIPFGKYKGRSIESIKNDQQYIDWLMAQSWFIEKHKDLYTIIINNFQEPNDTPQHNAMHVKFLNDDYVLLTLSKCHPGLESYAIYGKRFESDGWDAVVEVMNFTKDKYEALLDQISDLENQAFKIGDKDQEKLMLRQADDLLSSVFRIDFYVEIKPVVSDDFPTVLRQIKACRVRDTPNTTIKKVLFVGEYNGIGATKDEFVAFMSNEGIIVIFDN